MGWIILILVILGLLFIGYLVLTVLQEKYVFKEKWSTYKTLTVIFYFPLAVTLLLGFIWNKLMQFILPPPCGKE